MLPAVFVIFSPSLSFGDFVIDFHKACVYS